MNTAKVCRWLAAFCCVVGFGPAKAADLVVKAPPVAAWSWTGFYVGGHTGYETYRAVFPPSPGAFEPPRPSGGFIGGQAGAKYQVGSIVLGAELNAAWARIEDTHTGPDPLVPATLLSITGRVRAAANTTGRIGFASGRAHFYGLAGAGWREFESLSSTSSSVLAGGGPLTVSDRKWISGAVVGGGWEYAWDRKWIAGAEYSFFRSEDFRVRSIDPTTGSTPPFHVEAHSVMVRLSYKVQ